MELSNTSEPLALDTQHEKRKKTYQVLVILGLFLIIFLLYSKQKKHFIVTALPQTVGIQANSGFQFTLSPDNRWILYYENKFSYGTGSGSYGWVAFDTINKQKHYIGIDDTGTSNMFRVNMRNDCWSEDGKYCFLPVDKSIAIDFTNTATPVFSKSQLDNVSTNRLTCSDCDGSIKKGRVFSDNTHGNEHTSPNGRFAAQQISRGTGFVTPPSLYIIDTLNGKKYFIAKRVYYDMHFTSDSKGLYYYGCKHGGACDSNVDSLFFVDLSK